MIDKIDGNIVILIQENGKMSYSEIGERIGLSTSAVNERLKRLQADGVIKRYVALIDPPSVGLDVCAFVQVLIEAPEKEAPFLQKMQEVQEVQECYCITGEYSYLLKVRTTNTIELESLLREKIKSVEGIVRTNTIIALISSKEETGIPIPVA